MSGTSIKRAFIEQNPEISAQIEAIPDALFAQFDNIEALNSAVSHFLNLPQEESKISIDSNIKSYTENDPITNQKYSPASQASSKLATILLFPEKTTSSDLKELRELLKSSQLKDISLSSKDIKQAIKVIECANFPAPVKDDLKIITHSLQKALHYKLRDEAAEPIINNIIDNRK